MLSLPDVTGLFCDAHLIDKGQPRFISLWGRDTAMHEFFARLTIPEREGGLRSFVIGQGHEPGATRVMALDEERTKLWALLKQTLWLPVLDSRDAFVIAQFEKRLWLKPIEGYGIGAWLIDLSDRDGVDTAFGAWIRQGHLSVD